MRKIFGVVFLLILTVYIFAEQRNPECRYYLIAVTDHCPITMVTHELLLANIQVLDFDEQNIIIGIRAKSRLTRFIKEFPFARMLIEDLQDQRMGDINNKNLVKKFQAMKLIEEKNLRSTFERNGDKNPPTKRNHSGMRPQSNRVSTSIIKTIRMNIQQGLEKFNEKGNHSAGKGKTHA